MSKSKLALALTLLALLISVHPVVAVEIVGFEDFCYDEQCWNNPSADIAAALGGVAIPVTRDAVDAVRIMGASVGIGLDPIAEHAYICASAFGIHSIAGDGMDAGDYFCGELYRRQLARDRCSLFVHVPKDPTDEDMGVILDAIAMTRVCESGARWTYGSTAGTMGSKGR